MPLELAIRPRIRLHEGFSVPKPRRGFRVPRFALPVLAYWAVVGGVCHALLHAQPDQGPRSTALSASEVAGPLPAEPSDLSQNPGLPAKASEPSELTDLTTPQDQRAARLDREQSDDRGGDSSPGRSGYRHADRLGDAVAHAQAAGLAALTAPSAPFTAPSAPLTAPSAPFTEPSGARRGADLPTCEAASAAAVQDLDFSSSDRTADLPSAVIAGVLENGAWVSTCHVPPSTHFGVCVAIRRGQVTAVTVTTRPPDAALGACIRQRAAALQFPYSARLDIARTQF